MLSCFLPSQGLPIIFFASHLVFLTHWILQLQLGHIVGHLCLITRYKWAFPMICLVGILFLKENVFQQDYSSGFTFLQYKHSISMLKGRKRFAENKLCGALEQCIKFIYTSLYSAHKLPCNNSFLQRKTKVTLKIIFT